LVTLLALLFLGIGIFGLVMWQDALKATARAERQSQIANEQTQTANKEKQKADQQTKLADEKKLEAFAALEEAAKQKELALKSAKTAEQREAVAKEYAAKAKDLLNNLIMNPNVEKTLVVDTVADRNDKYELFFRSGLEKLRSFKMDGDISLILYKDALLNFKIAEFSTTEAKDSRRAKTMQDIAYACMRLRITADSLVCLKQFDRAKELYAQVLKKNKDDLYSRSQIAFLNTNNRAIAMVKVQAGEFMMGDSTSGQSDEVPVHLVKLSAYSISKTEVTNAQYAKFLNEYGSDTIISDTAKYFTGKKLIHEHDWAMKKQILKTNENNKEYIWVVSPGYEDYPVVYVTWYGSYQFCKFYGYTLPTEAQWEYAARGGVKNLAGFENPQGLGLKYAGTNNEDSLKLYAWYSDNNNPYGTKPVKQLRPNQLGIYDMSGNVWEWCWDWKDKYTDKQEVDPTGSLSGSYRVLRGGSWYDNASNVRSCDRNNINPSYGDSNIGFRCCSSSGQ